MSAFAPLKKVHPLLWLALSFGALAYLQTARFDFFYDDFVLITDNAAVHSWSKVPQYFTGAMFGNLVPEQSSSFYRPLFLLWLRLNHSLFWLASGYWHLMSVAAHLIATLFVFLLIRELLTEKLAGWTALLFAVHPAHLEAVAWISAGSEMLFTAMGLISLFCYLRYRETDRVKWLLGSAAAFAASLLCKETALVFLPLLLLLEFCITERKGRALRNSVIAFIGIAIVFLYIRSLALGSHGTIDDSRSLATMLASWPSFAWFYLMKLVWPFRLSYLYDVRFVESVTSIRFLFPVLAILGLLGAAVFLGLKRKIIWFASALAFLPLVPPILGTWAFNERDLVHDRYLYLPVLGFCLLVAYAIDSLRSSAIRQGAIAALTVAYMATLFAQGHIYRDNFTAFQRATEVASGNPLSWTLLGEEYLKHGRAKEAIPVFKAALDRDANNWLANFQLGRAYFETNAPQQAEVHFLRASSKSGYLDPASLGRQYFYLGLSQFRLGKLKQAEESLRLALKSSASMGYHFALGQVLEGQGRTDEAISEYEIEHRLSKSRDALRAIERLRSLKR